MDSVVDMPQVAHAGQASNAPVTHTRPPSDPERAALLRFERLFEQWRVATEKAHVVEDALWRETLRPTGIEQREQLARDAARLRRAAMEIYEQVLAAHRDRAG